MNNKLLEEKYDLVREGWFTKPSANPEDALLQQYGKTKQQQDNYVAWLYLTPDGQKFAMGVRGVNPNDKQILQQWQTFLQRTKADIGAKVKANWEYFKSYYTPEYGILGAVQSAMSTG